MIPLILSATAHEYYIDIVYRDRLDRLKSDHLYTAPIGGWTELDFDGDTCVYAAFLNTMVYKNNVVFRKMAKLYLDAILDIPGAQRVQLLNAMRILDPTFSPPWVNLKCRWQCAMMDDIVDTSYEIVSKCRNVRRLEKYVTVLQETVLKAQQQQRTKQD